MNLIKSLIPKKIIDICRPTYHYSLAFLGAVIYRFPSRKIKVVAITGTKGKSTTTEIMNTILEEAGFKTALANTLRFKIGNQEKRNLFKMTMPGRFFLQKFLYQATRENCDFAVIEMTSEGARQFRHKFIDLDALIFTNLSPEHIESHGSYENYVKAKLRIAESLSKSKKGKRILVINNDDKEAEKFKALKNTKKILYSLNDATNLLLQDQKSSFVWRDQRIETKLIGKFNIYNILGALSLAEALGVDSEKAKRAIEKIEKIRGRVEKIPANGFDVYVDYAHTIDSLTKLYEAFPNNKKICVLGNTGGGRDQWKRPGMAKVANEYCQEVILTNEDPYDEDPQKILDEMAVSVSKEKLKIILDRREAIRTSLINAKEKSSLIKTDKKSEKVVVLITGKGTDPFIMGPHGSKIPWDDAEVVREELGKLGYRV